MEPVFPEFISQLPDFIKRKLADFVKYPTDRNEAYIVGYLTALNECGPLDNTDYTYLLAVAGQITRSETMRRQLGELCAT